MPILVIIIRGRSALPEGRPMDLDNIKLLSFGKKNGSRWFGYFCNWFSVLFIIFTNVIFVFPQEYPVDASNMSE